MWMRNTFLPLSVAFLDEEGRILNIEDMQPQTEDNHCAANAARYALEMHLGWFAEQGNQTRELVLAVIEKSPAATISVKPVRCALRSSEHRPSGQVMARAACCARPTALALRSTTGCLAAAR
jgi:hypothetical protein